MQIPAATAIVAAIAIVVIVALLALLVLRARRPSGVRFKTIPLAEIHDVHRAISKQAVETSFAVFTVSTGAGKDDVEIQFSIEDGRAGVDWILLSPGNKQHRHDVMAYAAGKGARWDEREMNGWPYLRIDEGALADLCESLIRDLYGVDEVRLKYGGFRYR